MLVAEEFSGELSSNKLMIAVKSITHSNRMLCLWDGCAVINYNRAAQPKPGKRSARHFPIRYSCSLSHDEDAFQ